MEDHLEQQMVNELLHLLKGINATYKDFYHVSLLTIVDMKENACQDCVEKQAKCMRCVIGYVEKEKQDEALCDSEKAP